MGSKFMKKETIKENHITAFYSLNLGLFANIKKKQFEDWLPETQFKTEYFCRLPDLKMCLE